MFNSWWKSSLDSLQIHLSLHSKQPENRDHWYIDAIWSYTKLQYYNLNTYIYIYHYISLRGLWGQLQFFGNVSGLPQSLTEIGSWFGDVWNSLNWQWVGPPCQLVVRTKQLTINCTMYKSETPNGGRRLATPEKWFSSYLKSKIPNSNATRSYTKSEKKNSQNSGQSMNASPTIWGW